MLTYEKIKPLKERLHEIPNSKRTYYCMTLKEKRKHIAPLIEWVEERRKRGLCSKCDDELSKKSGSYCEKHLLKQHEHQKRVYYERKKKALCVQCCKPRNKGRTLCDYHLKKSRIYHKTYWI